jgi:D-alanyl-lipoteichoic acid acyltransferase DltB (MBOAT superfamily)
MLFNSISFAIFLPIVFLLHWFVINKHQRSQNLLLLAASYYFYACWDWRFLFLLIFSTLLDYFTGIKMSESENRRMRKTWLWISITINLGFLGVFKYYNFFALSFADAVANLGWHVNPSTIKVILPVGISFYTFHGLSYVLDIYNKRIRVERNFIDYSIFVSFFPLLVAGPIERATHLLPQIKKTRVFDYGRAVDGLRQILWGLFKKIVIADSCAVYANMIFNHSSQYSGIILVMGALLFTFQIYTDFSGYSDIALGTARLFGIDLLRNFAFPYFSRDIAEFWRRWHISLSSWFRDYLYIPLGGSKGGNWMRIRNTFIIFIVSGFWHGANWTFIFWGFLNALFIMPSIIFHTNRKNLDIVAQGRNFPGWRELFSMIITFSLTVIAWIFFRAESIGHAFSYLHGILAGLFEKQNYVEAALFIHYKVGFALPTLILIFFAIEWRGRMQQYAIANLWFQYPQALRWAIYYSIIFCIFHFGGPEQQFIYFQF